MLCVRVSMIPTLLIVIDTHETAKSYIDKDSSVALSDPFQSSLRPYIEDGACRI